MNYIFSMILGGHLSRWNESEQGRVSRWIGTLADHRFQQTFGSAVRRLESARSIGTAHVRDDRLVQWNRLSILRQRYQHGIPGRKGKEH